MKKLLFAMMLAVMAMPLAAQAAKEKIETPVQSEIADFCEKKPKPEKRGVQWDGEPADSAVMLFRAGDYELDYRRGIWLWLYHDGSFYVHLSRRTGVSFGTEGDDVIDGRLIGGCSREQLSEVLKKNDLLDVAKEKVPEDMILREEMEILNAAENGVELPPRNGTVSDEQPTTLQIPENEYKARTRRNRLPD